MKKTIFFMIILFTVLFLLSCPAVFDPEPFGRWNPADPEYDAATDPDAGTQPDIQNPVTGFTATAGLEEVSLSWTNPVSGSAGVIICFSTSAFPDSPEDGAEVYDGTGTSFIHTNITAGTYYYSAFAYDESNTFSERATAEAAPSARLRIYVADSTGGLAVIDVTDPENPSTPIYRDTAGTASGVAVTTDYAFIADGDGSFAVIDISHPWNPGNPIYVAPMQSSFAMDVVVRNNYAYVSDAFSYVLDVMDISSPENIEASSQPSGGSANGEARIGLDVAGDYAFIAGSGNGLAIVNVTYPMSPGTVQYNDIGGGVARDVFVKDDFAYLAVYEAGLIVVDITDPASPGNHWFEAVNGTPSGITVVGDYAFMASGSYGLAVMNVSDPTNPGAPAYLTTNDFAYDIAVYGDYAYLADGDAGLTIVDISTPFLPDLVGSVDTTGNAVGVTIQVP